MNRRQLLKSAIVGTAAFSLPLVVKGGGALRSIQRRYVESILDQEGLDVRWLAYNPTNMTGLYLTKSNRKIRLTDEFIIEYQIKVTNLGDDLTTKIMGPPNTPKAWYLS